MGRLGAVQLGENPFRLEAEAQVAEALALFRDLGSEWGQVNALSLLADIAAQRRDVVLAAHCYQESLALRTAIADRWGTVDILVGTAALAADCSRLEDATALLAAGVAWATELHYAMDYNVAPKPRDLASLLQGRLASVTFATAWRRGASMTPQEAIQVADAVLTCLAHDETCAPSTQPASSAGGIPTVLPAPGPRPVPGSAVPPTFELTRREREVLTLVCQRLTDPEIAEALFLSPRTASNHVANILAKLGAPNRRAAAAFAVRYGLV